MVTFFNIAFEDRHESDYHLDGIRVLQGPRKDVDEYNETIHFAVNMEPSHCEYCVSKSHTTFEGLGPANLHLQRRQPLLNT